MFTVYAEKEIFENIVLFNDTYPNWYKIFSNHSEVCLNITDAELNAELTQGTPIFEYIMANAGKEPIALKDFFDDIHLDKSVIAEKPRAAFLLNYPKVETDAMQSSYGIIVQNKDNIDDNILKGTYFKNLPKNLVIENQQCIGWKKLLNFSIPPSNSMVINDEYLFTNEENSRIIGQFNVLHLIDSLLPHNLDIPYHILIVTTQKNKSNEWYERLAGNLKAQIISLRQYPIIFELVFTDSIHKRKLILNYVNATCDKGFAIFKVSDNKTVRETNDLRFDRIFNRIDPHEGDSDYTDTHLILTELKSICDKAKNDISTSAVHIPNKRILGDCNPDKSLKNRLINDV